MRPYLEQLVKNNIATANAIAHTIWKTAPYSLEKDELQSIAYFGLVAAAARWEDYCEENDFSSEKIEYFRAYAMKRMRGAIFDHFRSTDWATRALRSKEKSLREAGSETGASEAELIERTGFSQKQIRSTTTRMANKPIPLEEAMSGEYEPQTDSPTELVVDSNLILTVFSDSVLALPEDQQTVLILRYFDGVDLREIARRMGISDLKASKLHTSGVMAVHDILVEYLNVEDMV